ncbi:tRNA-dependent cyclodipeptide synthase [Nocardia sp. CDC153]|uniref:tRNA-dependent cyclodipeptide synthase n=1 Tax=Nocardia sp. CDC153 TaxID=3112167 RepID=UPI002DB5C95B|nr:tRNA-dependent cyclodipeptide synthase [Nocardia sp. CDC153]MEC3953175.1 tRNA-dependent cyclodipeptide synthase [Nocardia sp. CDC153]
MIPATLPRPPRESTEPIAQEGFSVQPFTAHCRVILDDGDHAIIGVSPGNSYFSGRRIQELARWGLARFDRADFVYTDVFQAEMYEALGYSQLDARRKAVKNLRGVRAKITAAVAEADPSGQRLAAHPISAFQNYPAYRRLHADLVARLAGDEEFAQVCHGLVDSFLSSKVLSGAQPTARQQRVCLDYICAEAPLFLDTPAILGVPSSLNCYHQLLPMAELLYSRGAGLRASRNQGHAIVTPAEGLTA